jgi:hypothetical protein
MSPIKINCLTEILNSLNESIQNYNTFIETGTLNGESTIEMEPFFEKIHTIELSEKYFLRFEVRKNFLRKFKIQNHYGDSSIVLPNLLSFLSDHDTCIFWLDGHYSSGDTAKGSKDCPVIEECIGIDSKYKGKKAVILIDDYRLFETKKNENWIGVNQEAVENSFLKFKKINHIIYQDILAIAIEKK